MPTDHAAASVNTTRDILKLYWGHVWRYPAYAVGIFTVLPITLLMHQFLPPLVIAAILNKLSEGDFTHGDLWGSFGPLLLLYAFLRITSATVIWRIVIVLLGKLEANVLRDIARRIFDHLLSQSSHFHADRFSGTLVSQTTKFMTAYVRLADAAVLQFLPLVLSFFFVVFILLPRAPQFVAMLLVGSLIFVIVTLRGTRLVRVKSSEDAEAQSQQSGYLADALTNIMTVKSFAAHDYERQRFARATAHTRRKTLDYLAINNSRELYFSVISSSITTLSIILATASVVLFGTDIAVTYLVIDYSATLVARLWQFSSVTLRDINRAFGEASDMTKLLKVEPAVKDPIQPEALRIGRGHVTFQDVTFTHADANEALFNRFGLDIPAGEKVGLVGRSGAGKTTFTNLLLRFSDLDGGAITIDGQNIAAITQDDLRRNIAYVPQEPLLFHRSIRENIAYGKPDASDKEIEDATRKAHAHEFIEKLPHGYDTLVGERGIKLSGGQRQRVAIARAILKNAPILVLDEATSALDSESETAVQAALKTLMRGRTTIVIAHRLSTIQKMDRIVVIEEGKVIEDGTHAQLIKQGATYAKLWAHQSGGFIAQFDQP
jgi:ATP-binding cassette subfamily B protein